jgi:pentatricopeptide repeat protein
MSLYCEMRRDDVVVDARAYRALLRACERGGGQWHEAVELLRHMMQTLRGGSSGAEYQVGLSGGFGEVREVREEEKESQLRGKAAAAARGGRLARVAEASAPSMVRAVPTDGADDSLPLGPPPPSAAAAAAAAVAAAEVGAAPFNTVLRMCARAGQWRSAVAAFAAMREMGVSTDVETAEALKLVMAGADPTHLAALSELVDESVLEPSLHACSLSSSASSPSNPSDGLLLPQRTARQRREQAAARVAKRNALRGGDGDREVGEAGQGVRRMSVSSRSTTAMVPRSEGDDDDGGGGKEVSVAFVPLRRTAPKEANSSGER